LSPLLFITNNEPLASRYGHPQEDLQKAQPIKRIKRSFSIYVGVTGINR
jgi:hypothetical protein